MKRTSTFRFDEAEFVAVGNDSGLFIIVENKRKWYPTEQQAEKHFTKIKIATGDLVKEITINKNMPADTSGN